ncbi:MAG: RluA family pseudouridine synthase [Pyrinomonadaceae bacterium]
MPDDSQTPEFSVTAEDAGERLDAFLASHVDGWSRSRLKRLIDDADVLVNGEKAKASYKLREGDEIEVDLVELPPTEFTPEDIPLNIVYEDEFLALINKPAGMIVHPGAGITGGTLANALAHHFSLVPHPSSLVARPGIVHRLDKDTSGLIVVAKDEQTAEELSRQFHDREVEKSYIALVHGVLDEDSGTIDSPLARDKHNRTRMRVAAHGRAALSLWEVKQRFDKFTLLEVEIKTGRTHQIRVHLASINHPVVGDETYNAGRDKTVADLSIRKAIADLGRFFLHAERLAFTHPKTGDRLEFSQQLAEELEQFLKQI